jgi:hypothetical protein
VPQVFLANLSGVYPISEPRVVPYFCTSAGCGGRLEVSVAIVLEES